MGNSRRNKKVALLAVAALFNVTMMGLAQASTADRLPVINKPTLDLSGKKRFGKASFYAPMFTGRKMADGKTMKSAT